LEGESGWVKLVDFGLAHAADDVHLTQTGAILGTPAYMSPEQARGDTVDGRSDLFSLGAVLYKLATGEMPFRGASTMAVLMALATETPRPPIELNPELPPALNDLILRLLAKKPDDRFQSAQAVAEAIRAIEAQLVERNSFRSGPSTSPSAHERNKFRSTIRRWPLVAAAAAAAFVLATIVIIVRDRHGNEVLRATVPEGGSAEASSSEDQASGMRKLPGSSDASNGLAPTSDVHHREADASRSPRLAAISPPANVPEPPPLEEWLKDRKVLTVAQDGSAQFKTIQAALDALQSGQVVSVLDRGPYRERLVLEGVPRDTGLISKQGTIIELSEWEFAWKGEAGDVFYGHVLSDADGFRLHGFEMVFPEEKRGRRLWIRHDGGLVVEHCQFRALATETWETPSLVLENKGDDLATSVWMRHCLVEGYLEITAWEPGDAAVTAVVERNYFTCGHSDHHLRFTGDAWKQVLVRHNVFRGQAVFDLLVVGWKSLSALEVANNTTTTASDLVVFSETAPHGGVSIRNNLRTAPNLILLLQGAEKETAAAQGSWRVDHNAYPVASATSWIDKEGGLILRSPADVPMTPRFLSKDPASPDYLRISADGPLATAGAGGEWPSYVGALPPGPAPKEGDWFTRLQERWRATEPAPAAAKVTDIPPPADVPEPPPLEEWMKDRKVLTVAQDGSGQFKTIQAALDALKPHQVVKVLDRG
ncbi:MAG TPA: protein kinase, partial [Pirellulales bacterium]|nr:protein kinase [Pirellulales bacterium]